MFLLGFFFFFLQNADVANFSIHVHSEPGFVFDEWSAFFYNRQLTNSIKVIFHTFDLECIVIGEDWFFLIKNTPIG